MTKIKFIWIVLLIVIVGCEKESIQYVSVNNDKPAHRLKSVMDGLSPHFQEWLNENGYGSYDFLRSDIDGGSFGGKLTISDQLVNEPVIFIHGNSDKALGTIFGQSGWMASVDYFMGNSYSNAELYGFTWGPANVLLSAKQGHTFEYISRIRAFILAVKEYTGAQKVDIIAHSMGVTLVRKAIKGGVCFDDITNSYKNLGSPISNSVDAFVGIAGANQGLVSCYMIGGATETCDNDIGLYPGYLFWGMGPYGVSDILVDINSSQKYEGDYIYSIWSTVDEVIGYGCLVYGKYTTRIPGQNGEKVFNSFPYGHFNVKDKTGYYQLKMVNNHQIN